jgi:hypothetical protein
MAVRDIAELRRRRPAACPARLSDMNVHSLL